MRGYVQFNKYTHTHTHTHTPKKKKDLLSRPFPFITEEVTSKLMAEKDEYHIAASSVDVGYDLWEFWRDNRMRIPHWYSVAKDMALMQPSFAFMERVFSVLRACMDER